MWYNAGGENRLLKFQPTGKNREKSICWSFVSRPRFLVRARNCGTCDKRYRKRDRRTVHSPRSGRRGRTGKIRGTQRRTSLHCGAVSIPFFGLPNLRPRFYFIFFFPRRISDEDKSHLSLVVNACVRLDREQIARVHRHFFVV